MKPAAWLALLMVVLNFILSGCSFTREPIRYREDFFRPITVLPQRNRSVLSSTEIIQLKNQLESATKEAIRLRDSLASLRQVTVSVSTSKNPRVDTVTECESKVSLTTTKQADQVHSIAELPSENKLRSQQLTDVPVQNFTSKVDTMSSVFTPTSDSSLKNEYSEGVSFVEQGRYDDALITFRNLLKEGIAEDIADNCEYWTGECYFAKREYNDAIEHFQKVIAIKSSNKLADAYFMLGKSYERTGDVENARITYAELIARYPNNGHARIVRARLKALTDALHAKRNSK